MNNPLLNIVDLPDFNKINFKHIEPAVDNLLKNNRKIIKNLINSTHEPSWDELNIPLEKMHHDFDTMWAQVSHLNSVCNSPELQHAYDLCLPKISEFETELGQNRLLYEKFLSLKSSNEFENLNCSQKKIVDNAIRDFKLSGVDLNTEDKKIYEEYQKLLTNLESKFSLNVLNSKSKWFLHIETLEQLNGLSEFSLNTAKKNALEKNLAGWVFDLSQPSYIAIMTQASNRELREKMYHAYVTRASKDSFHQPIDDNSEIIVQILEYRRKLSHILSYENYAEYSLVEKMADNTKTVLDFLENLVPYGLALSKKELQELHNFSIQFDDNKIDTLKPFDIGYYSEKLKNSHFNIDQDSLRAFFPIDKVLDGLFKILCKVFSIICVFESKFSAWHEYIQLIIIKDQNNVELGKVFLDLFTRANKQDGAWMSGARSRFKHKKIDIKPVAYIVTNFAPPQLNHQALLTHDDVVTLFHEFGHAIHHVITDVVYPSISGGNGVAWDAIELPSQMLENWCWEEEALSFISGHFLTNEPLTPDILKNLKSSKNFQVGLHLSRQLEFALFDFEIHCAKQQLTFLQVTDILNNIRSKVSTIKTMPYNQFQNSFTHIFSGGYAAGYYSYKWAEVLSADAFQVFLENGIFDNATGMKFRDIILAKGGSLNAMELFVKFRGREPSIQPLLLQSGLI